MALYPYPARNRWGLHWHAEQVRKAIANSYHCDLGRALHELQTLREESENNGVDWGESLAECGLTEESIACAAEIEADHWEQWESRILCVFR